MGEFRGGLSFTSATRALAWDNGFVLECGDVARSRMILAGERLRLVATTRGDARVVVEDPCGGGFELAVCSEARQVTVEVVCSEGGAVVGLE